MEPTQRFWRTAAIAGFLAGFGALVGQSLLVLGAGAITALLLVRQWAFFAAARDVEESLSVDLDLPQTAVRQQESLQATLAVALGRPATVDTTVTLEAPLLAAGDQRLAVEVPAGQQHGETTAQFRWPTAGTATFAQPTVTLAAADGLFTERLRRGPSQSVVVEPRVPRNLHVGEGGEQLDAAFGMHRTGEFGQGTDPAELREYTPGDDVSTIDWKATARQGEAYVREYEVESDRRTILLFDHRSSTATGPAGEEAYTYLQEVALTVVSAVERFDDPVGLYAIGDGGLTSEFSPATDSQQYDRIRTTLRGLDPTTATGGREGVPDQRTPRQRQPAARTQTGVTAAAAKATTLETAGSQFATTLHPFFADAQQYVRRIDGEPLFDVARTYADSLDGGSQALVFTTDSDPAQVREAVRAARGDAGHVVVFLAPLVLFEEGGMADLDAAYDRYTSFERFRKQLMAMDRVAAYEVAPDDRLEAVLAAGRDRVR